MVVNIKDREITLKYSFRAFMIFEQITESSFTGKNMSEFITFFYSMLMASDREIDITFDEFIDWLDDNSEIVSDFITFITNEMKKQKSLSSQPKEVKDVDGESKN